MAAISGKNGKVLAGAVQLAHITGWSLNPTSNNPDWASSDTSGTKNRVAGITDSSGSFDFKWDSTSEIWDTLTEGTEVTLNLYLSATVFIIVPAIIDGISFEVDINDGDTVSGTADFSQSAAITYP